MRFECVLSFPSVHRSLGFSAVCHVEENAKRTVIEAFLTNPSSQTCTLSLSHSGNPLTLKVQQEPRVKN